MPDKSKKVMNVVNRIAGYGTDIIYYGLISIVLLAVFGVIALLFSPLLALLLFVIVLLIWAVVKLSKPVDKGKDS